MTKKLAHIENDVPTLRILPIARDGESEDRQKNILEMQLQMATSSINHEYARVQFDDTVDRDKREELLIYMHDCRIKYFEAREVLERFDPGAVLEFEKDLIKQKLETMTEYNA